MTFSLSIPVETFIEIKGHLPDNQGFFPKCSLIDWLELSASCVNVHYKTERWWDKAFSFIKNECKQNRVVGSIVFTKI